MSDRDSEQGFARELEDFLSNASAYPEPAESVRRIETHISVVFLIDAHVYKAKKPVRFPFLDYSTLEKRRAACLDEVRLNRRLAPDVYLGVRPIVRKDDGSLAFADRIDPGDSEANGAGEVVDYCVEMKRLPDDRMMHDKIVRDSLTNDDVGAILDRLIAFEDLARRGPDVDAGATADAIEAAARENFETLDSLDHGVPERVLARARSSQLAFLRLERERFAKRIAAGRVREGHGDLRPEHVCCLDPPAVFDCVEFSLEFRASDVLHELAFLAMECEVLGARDVADALLAGYRQRTDDDAPLALFRFYEAYCATVRAKVDALRAEQESDESGNEAAHRLRNRVRRYLQLAAFFALDFHRPHAIVVMGTSGSGKSTVAKGLADRLGAAMLSSDAIRRELFGAPTEAAAEYGAGLYTPERVASVYTTLLDRAREKLDESGTVVLDATFRNPKQRDAVRALAREMGAEFVVLWCRCPAAVARARIEHRLESGDGLSDARPEHVDRQLAEIDADPEGLGLDVQTVDTSGSIEQSIAHAERALRDAVHLLHRDP